MTTVPLERTDLELIEALDFEHTPACELQGHTKPGGPAGPHGGPAHVLVDIHCPKDCAPSVVHYVCGPWWSFVTTTALPGRCSWCGEPGSALDFYTVLSWVNQ